MSCDYTTQRDIEDLSRKVSGKAERHEVDTLRRDVDSLERTVRDLSAAVDGLRAELCTTQNRVSELLPDLN